MNSPSIRVYTRQGCCLCEDARTMIEGLGLIPQMVDIDQDPELSKRYTDCVPVVEVNGKVRFRGRINKVLLTRLLIGEKSNEA